MVVVGGVVEGDWCWCGWVGDQWLVVVVMVVVVVVVVVRRLSEVVLPLPGAVQPQRPPLTGGGGSRRRTRHAPRWFVRRGMAELHQVRVQERLHVHNRDSRDSHSRVCGRE